MRSAEEWLLEVFNPSPMDCQTWRDDLQLAITLNPSLELIEKAINEARSEAIRECAEKIVIDGNPEVAKKKILELLNNIQ